MKFLTKNVKIALTVIVGMALLYWGINYLKGVNLLTPANRYFTEVKSTDGLLEAAPVTVNGFQVGQVREINYDYQKNKITVMLAMDKDMTIPEGSTLNMVTGLMGGASLVLNLGDGAAMKPGSYIPTTDIPGLMDHVTENVLPMVNGMLPKVDCCAEAIRAGVRNVVIMDGRIPHSILMELLTDEGAGTMVMGGNEE